MSKEFPLDQLDLMRQLTSEFELLRQQAESERDRLVYDFRERKRELRCLYAFYSLCQTSTLDTDKFLQEVLDLVPTTWQLPDESCARICLPGKEIRTSNFIVETQWRHAADIAVHGEPVGVFEVFYLEAKPPDFDGQLLWEREELRTAIADGIGKYLEVTTIHDRYQEKMESLKEAERVAEEKVTSLIPRLKAAMAKSEKSQSIANNFLARITHQIRSPISELLTISGRCLEAGSEELRRDYLATVKALAERLLHIVDEIRDYSQLEIGEFKRDNIDFSLREVVDSALVALADDARRRQVELIGFIDPLVPDHVVGDPTRLRQIIFYLMTNAVSRTEKGQVTLRVEVEVTSHMLPIYHFSISDNGLAIDDNIRTALFDGFAPLESNYSLQMDGPGLGPAISGRLVELMGGEIWIERPTDEYTTENDEQSIHFTMWFDIKKAGKPTAENWSPGVEHKAIVAIYNATNREMFRASLENWGWVPAIAATGGEIQDLLRRDQEHPYDAVIVDEILADTDGRSVIDGISALPENIRPEIVFVGAPGALEDGRHNDLVFRHLVKPVRQSEFKAVIEDIRELHELATPAADDPKSTTASTLPDRSRVLLISDSLVNRFVIEQSIHQWGYKTKSVFDVDQALAVRDVHEVRAVVIDATTEGKNSAALDMIENDTMRIAEHILPVMVLRENTEYTALTQWLSECTTITADNPVEPFADVAEKESDGNPVPPDESTTKNRIEQFNLEKAMEAAGDDVGRMIDTLDTFTIDCEMLMQKLQRAIGEHDHAGVADILGAFEKLSGEAGAVQLQSILSETKPAVLLDAETSGACLEQLQEAIKAYSSIIGQYDLLSVQ